MKVTQVEIFPLTLELSGSFRMASTAISKQGQFTILRIHTDEGITGLGDCGRASPQHSRESQGTVLAMLRDYLVPQVLGEDPFNLELIHANMDKVVLGCWLGKAGIDYALHDIAGKALGVPVYQLLGGKSRDRVPLGWMVSLDEPKAMAEDAVRGLEAGYAPFLRLKVGTGVNEDVARVREVRNSVGEDISISVDANRAYTTEVAINAIRRMDEYHLDHAEQPVPDWDITGLARVAEKLDVPIFADDSAWSIEGAITVIKLNAADGLLLKPTRAGGFYKSRIYAGIAMANNMPLIGASMAGTGIEATAIAHAGVSFIKFGDFPNLFLGPLMNYGGLDTRHITERVITSYPVIENGHLLAPSGPGLGIELDEDFVRKHLTPGMEAITCKV